MPATKRNAMALHPEVLLPRREAAAALTEAGYPTATATLARKACVGGGPVYRRYGARVVYRWVDLVAWAESRLGPPIRSTAELDAAQRDDRSPAPNCVMAQQGGATGALAGAAEADRGAV